MTALGKRVALLEVQARADKWAVFNAWLDGLPRVEKPVFNIENAVSIDAALCSRFPELVGSHNRNRAYFEQDKLAAAQIAAEDAGVPRDQIMKQFDPPPWQAGESLRLESQHYANVIAGILLSENLTADERAFLLASKASLEWVVYLLSPQIETAETVC